MTANETVTALFTDLVGSTGMESRVGPEAAAKLRRDHFRALRAAIGDCGGIEVKNTGDGMVAVFRSAVDALSCAVCMQQRVARRNQRDGEPLAMRIGVALGDALCEEGDYFGRPMVEAARLCARADGGEVLLTDLVRTVGGRDGDAFDHVGELELKGIPDPVSTWLLSWEPAPARDAPTLPPALRSPPSDPSVGRAAEHATVRECARAAYQGERRALVIGGEPGIGKSRFLMDAATGLQGDGAVVLFGHCEEGLGAPYGPWIEALSQLVELMPEHALAAHVERHGAALTRLVPALHRRVPVPTPGPTDPETERYLLFSAVGGILERQAEELPVALLLDDLQWADRPTLSLVRHVLAETGPAPLLFLCTYAEADVTEGHPLRELLGDLHRTGRVDRLGLTGLGDDEVASLLELAVGEEVDASGTTLIRELAAETGGNPFFLRELLRHLAESGLLVRSPGGHWTVVDGFEGLELPQSVREVISRRVERLGHDCSAALSTAAVLGREFDLELLARVVDLDEDGLIDVLDAAVGASIVREAERPGSYAFVHNLINHTLSEQLSATRRARIHRRSAEALERLGPDPSPSRLRELAHHLSAGAATDPGPAARYCRLAGERALAELAPDEAVGWFERARALLEGTGAEPAERCETLIRLGEAECQAARPGFRETLLEAGRVADELGDADRMARAALANSRGLASSFGQVDRERVTALERAGAANRHAPPARRARLLSLQAMELQFDPDHERRRGLAEDGLALAREAHDPRVLFDVLRDAFHAVWSTDTIDRRRRLADEMTTLAEQIDDPLAAIWALETQLHVMTEAGQLGEAAAACVLLRERADKLGHPGLRWHATYCAAGLAQVRGDLDDAAELAQAAFDLGMQAGEPDALVVYLAQLCAMRIEQGRTDEIIAQLESAVAANPGLPAFESGLAVALCEVGRHAEAAERLERATAARFADVPRDHVWSAALAAWARAAAEVGSRRAATRLFDLLEPYSELTVWNGVVGYGAVESYLGMLAATVGAHERAAAHFAAASRRHDRMGVRVWEARSLCYRSASELASGAIEDARATAERAAALAQAGGYAASERRARELFDADVGMPPTDVTPTPR